MCVENKQANIASLTLPEQLTTHLSTPKGLYLCPVQSRSPVKQGELFTTRPPSLRRPSYQKRSTRAEGVLLINNALPELKVCSSTTPYQRAEGVLINNALPEVKVYFSSTTPYQRGEGVLLINNALPEVKVCFSSTTPYQRGEVVLLINNALPEVKVSSSKTPYQRKTSFNCV
ncbi:hypothetical protein RRG08_057635 [Elysia crispata]|uniref:Uncharacterized protein n=1 Tax=Elysia crispata TaxID=231223 RepID=A0AAE1DR57_9GAST|nr:hypothetical protein RRG08_057635 [Elysia crispata]